MTATGHAVLGTVIAAKIGNPALAIPIALASHLAADAFPHWDTATNGNRKNPQKMIISSFIDVALSFLLSFFLLSFLFPSTNLYYGFLIVFSAQFFDWLTAPYYFFNIQTPPFTWTYKLQKIFDNELNKPWGIINQVGILALILLLAKIF